MKSNYLKHFLFSTALLLSTATTMAQKETNWWFFGYKAGLNFNILAPKTSNSGITLQNMPKAVDGPLDTDEGVFVLSNANGELMLSGDGVYVYNKNGQRINTTPLGGGKSSTQSGIIIPKPGSPNQYYVISVQQQGDDSGIQYAIVDMTYNGGLGGIVSQNHLLLAGPTGENITAVRKKNNNGFWLMHRNLTKNNTNPNATDLNIFVWNVSPSGITLHNQTTETVLAPISNNILLGAIKFSTDGTKFASGLFDSNALLFGDFNPATGMHSNVDFLSVNSILNKPYGVEFSPDSNLLYVSSGEGFAGTGIQIKWEDVVAKNTANVKILPYVNNLQLAVDGRIYGVTYNKNFLTVVPEPNKVFSSPNDYLVFNGYLTKNASFGLPTFASSYFAGEVDPLPLICKGNSSIFTINISFTGNPTDFPSKLVWDWGDATATTEQAVIATKITYVLPHTYMLAGEKEITIIPYTAANNPLAPIKIKVNITDCQFQGNRQIRVNVDNATTQKLKK